MCEGILTPIEKEVHGSVESYVGILRDEIKKHNMRVFIIREISKTKYTRDQLKSVLLYLDKLDKVK